MAVDTVSISEQILGRILVSEGLDDLLRRPGRTGMLRHMEMQHLATTMFQHQEYEQHLHRNRRHGEEVDGDHLIQVIVQEGLPGLPCRRGNFRSSRETVRSEIWMPSIFNSP